MTGIEFNRSLDAIPVYPAAESYEYDGELVKLASNEISVRPAASGDRGDPGPAGAPQPLPGPGQVGAPPRASRTARAWRPSA